MRGVDFDGSEKAVFCAFWCEFGVYEGFEEGGGLWRVGKGQLGTGELGGKIFSSLLKEGKVIVLQFYPGLVYAHLNRGILLVWIWLFVVR